MPRSRKPAPAAAPRRPKYSAPAVEKALDILEYLSQEAVPLTQAQLARALNRHPGELFRMLTCLEERGYLRREPTTGAYALSLKLFELSRTHSPFETLLQVAVPFMRSLSETVRESCHLSVLHRDRVLVLAQEESTKPFRLSVEVGSLHPVTGTTSGRLLLAHMAAGARDELLGRDPVFRRRPEPERTAFLERLRAIRERGYERTDGEWFEGALDLAVVVGGPGAQTRASLVIAALRQRHQEMPEAEMLTQLRLCAAAIGAAAGVGGGRGAP